MANEFVARKGIVSLGNIQVSGSISATGAITITGSIASASFAATASSADNFVVRQNLTGSNVLATGTITAQTLVVQTVTSSIVYTSGSNIFGNLPSNVQQFTGSLRVTGSGNHYIVGGNVGIGITTPRSLVEIQKVSGNTCIGATSNATLTLSQAGAINEISQIGLGYTLLSSPAVVGYITTNAADYTNGSLIFATRNVTTDTAPTERMRIDSSGNVGIGYTPCTSYGPLQVKSPASSYTVDLVGRTAGLNGESQITFWNSGQTVVQGAIGNIARCMVFYAGGTEVMRMTCAGNVGIGACSPEGLLTIKGISCQPLNSGTTANSLLQIVGSLNNELNIGLNCVSGCYGAYLQVNDNNLAVNYPLNLQPNGGQVSIGTYSTSAEANLFLGAQGTVEGGQLVLQKGTSCSCATHLDNYNDSFRILVGSNTTSTGVNMAIDHKTGNTTINGAVYRYSGQTVVGGSFTNLTAIDASSSRTYLIQMIPTNVEAAVSYRIFGVIQVNATSGTYAFTTLSSQTMDVTFSGSTVQAKVTNGQQWTFNWSITQLL